MPVRRRLIAADILAGILTLLILVACQTQPQALPTMAVFPTAPPPATPTTPPPTARATATPSLTATPACSQVIREANLSLRSTCAESGIGEVCYGAPGVSLVPRPGVAAPPFVAPGDHVDLAGIEQLNTTAYDTTTHTWGLAELRTRADPEGITPGQWVTVLMFGEVMVRDAGNGSGPFQSMKIMTGAEASACNFAPLPGTLIYNGTLEVAELDLNGLTARLDGQTALLVRAQMNGEMLVVALQGDAQVSLQGSLPLDMLPGTQLRMDLAGPDGLETTGTGALEPLDRDVTDALPLAALPQAVAISPPLLATVVDEAATTAAALAATETPEPTATLEAPFYGTPPNGAYLTYPGQRVIADGDAVFGTFGAGGSDSWVFTPIGLAPDSFDSLEVEALGDWDPVLTIESATWGVYAEDYNAAEGPIETYIVPLAGSGGDWRITIRDLAGRGGSYRLRYTCFGNCAPETEGEEEEGES